MKTLLLFTAALCTPALACPAHDSSHVPERKSPTPQAAHARNAPTAKSDSKPPAAKPETPAPKPAPKEPERPGRPNYLLM